MVLRVLSICVSFMLCWPAGAKDFFTYDNISISGTPSELELQNFKKQEGAIVVDLRAIDELGNCSESATAAKLGLQYDRVNFEKKDDLDSKVLAEIDAKVNDAQGKPILLFCKTGSRAAAWLATYLAREKNMSVNLAVQAVKAGGLSDNMEKAVRKYLATFSVREK